MKLTNMESIVLVVIERLKEINQSRNENPPANNEGGSLTKK